MLLKDQRLGTFDGQRHDRHLKHFRSADNTHLLQSAARIRRQVAEHAIGACNRHADQNSLIRKEANKKTRHLPLRTLFDRSPDVLTAVRPCWAMSPLDVAQTLPPHPLFDPGDIRRGQPGIAVRRHLSTDAGPTDHGCGRLPTTAANDLLRRQRQ